MKTVLGILEAMHKATFKQVASELHIKPVDALEMLRKERAKGNCDFIAGFWVLTGKGQEVKAPSASPPTAKTARGREKSAPSKPATPEKSTPRGEAPASVDPQIIVQLLQQNGAMKTAALAAAVNRAGRGMTSAMFSLERQGLVIRVSEGKGTTWAIPEVSHPAETPLPDTPAEELPTLKSTAELISEIPAFAPRDEVAAIPTPANLSRAIRRTESKLASLKKLRGAVAELSRHKRLLQEISR